MRAKMASALAVKSGCSLLQRNGQTWLVAAVTDAHSAASWPLEPRFRGSRLRELAR